MDSPQPPKLLEQVRNALRTKHYAYRPEEAYVQWVRRFILFHSKRHPKEMAEPEVHAFLTSKVGNPVGFGIWCSG